MWGCGVVGGYVMQAVAACRQNSYEERNLRFWRPKVCASPFTVIMDEV
jgi:hypothetical protein